MKGFYTAGGLLWVLCGIGILLLPRNMNAFMYILSIFIGIANALIMVRLMFYELSLISGLETLS